MKNVTTAPGKASLQKQNFSLAHTSFTCFIEVDTMVLARGTVGFSGADLQNLVK